MTARVSGLNHLTLAVGDLARSLAFYRDVLGCVLRARWATGAYLEAGSLWLCLSVGPVSSREDYTHAAFSVSEDDFAILSERVRAACTIWQDSTSEGASVYMLDPDGHRLELHVGSLASRLDSYEAQGRTDIDIYRGGATATFPAHPDPAGALVASWDANADAWADAVRSGAIASRRLVTDNAVLKAVLRYQPRRVLDLGCGEGWLSRALADEVEHVVGLDVSHDLVVRAQAAGGGEFHQASYADLVTAPARFGCDFDVIVANFALLDEALQPLLSALASTTRPGGALVIQTLHPATQPPPYKDGWRQEDFSGFAGERWTPMPWYFRTLGSWLHDIGRCWRVTAVAEPVNPITGMPASLLIEAVRQGAA